MAKSSPNNSEYFEAFRTCFENRGKLVKTIDEIDYILSGIQDRRITIKDLFLEKNDDLRMKCANLLLEQVQYQHQLLKHIPHNGDLQILLDEFSKDGGCLKHILSNEVTNHVHGLFVAQTNVHISFASSARLDPINCQLLVNFADKLLQLVIDKMKIHQENCDELSPCVCCNSLNDEDIDVHQLTPTATDELQNEGTDITDNLDLTSPRDNRDYDIAFNDQAAALQEEYSWERFKDIVLKKYNNLKRYYEENVEHLKGMALPVVIVYTDTKGDVKVENCATIPEARRRANSLEDITKDLFPVVLISTTDYRFPSIVSRKRMVQKFNFDSSSKVGEEETPSIFGTLQTPPGREPIFESAMLFYLDTGADTGSVGYNYHIIKHFILTVENINNTPEPAILCSFHSAKVTSEEIQVFDVDQHHNWNAIGLSVLKNYKIYLDIRNGRVEIGRHEDVTENESDETFEVIFKKFELSSSPFPDDL